jgi:PAS domain S-box-containing protein
MGKTADEIIRLIKTTYVASVDEEDLNGLFNRLPLPVSIMQGPRVLFVNKAFSQLFGYSLEEARRVPTTDLFAPEHRVFVESNIMARSQRIDPGAGLEMLGLRKDGTVFEMSVQVGLIELPKIDVAIGFFNDLTLFKRMELEAHRNKDKYKAALNGIVQISASLFEQRDPYTAGHERRVTDLACLIGIDLGLDDEAIEGLRIASTLHDIGKVSIPMDILNKPGKLSSTEFRLIKEHPQTGHNILSQVDFPWTIASIVLQHHERIDGSGYPAGLKGKGICLEARIIGIADVVEAMSSHRPYRPSLGIDAALDEIRQNKGSLYEPEIVDACLKIFKENRYDLPVIEVAP